MTCDDKKSKELDESWPDLDVHRLDHGPRHVEWRLRGLWVGQDGGDDPGPVRVEDEQMPDVGGPLRVYGDRERVSVASRVSRLHVAAGERLVRQLDLDLLTRVAVDLDRRRVGGGVERVLPDRGDQVLDGRADLHVAALLVGAGPRPVPVARI